jgi:hypothetical protein
MKNFLKSMLVIIGLCINDICAMAAHLKYAIIQSPVIGRARRSAGGMTFTTLFGKNIMKAKVFQVRDAMTAAQLTVRDWQKRVVLIISSISSHARQLFEIQPSDMSAYSKLISQMLSVVLKNNYQGIMHDIVFGQGSIDSIHLPSSFNATSEKSYNFSIAGTPLVAYGADTDNMFLILVNATKNFAEVIDTGLVRNDEGGSNDFSARYEVGDHVYGWLGFVAADGVHKSKFYTIKDTYITVLA